MGKDDLDADSRYNADGTERPFKIAQWCVCAWVDVEVCTVGRLAPSSIFVFVARREGWGMLPG